MESCSTNHICKNYILKKDKRSKALQQFSFKQHIYKMFKKIFSERLNQGINSQNMILSKNCLISGNITSFINRKYQVQKRDNN